MSSPCWLSLFFFSTKLLIDSVSQLHILQNKKHIFMSIPYIILLLLHVNVPSTEALIYTTPAHLFHSHFYVHNGSRTSKLPANHYRVMQRELTSDERYMKNNLKGSSGDGYFIELDIGSPVQKTKVLIDTGSSNFAIAASENPSIAEYFHRERSSTFQNLGTGVYVPYTEGEWKGDLGTDIVTVLSAPNISARVYIACITESKNFFSLEAEWQGILGLGYKELARPSSSVTPFWDSILETHPNIDDIFSMCLCGLSFVHTENKPLLQGSLIFGGVIPSLSKTPLQYAPIVRQMYYEVTLTDIYVDDKPLPLHCKELNFDKTIVDSGTTNIRLPTKVFNELVTAIQTKIQVSGIIDSPNQSFFNGDDILCLSDLSRLFFVFPVISFSVMVSENSSFTLHLTPQHYLRPVEMEDESIISCIKFGFSPSTTGTVLGAVLMEGFYVVFDRNASRIGFGQTTCPLPDPRYPVLNITISGPYNTNKNNGECIYKKSTASDKSFLIVSYVMIGVTVIVFLPLILLLTMWIRERFKYVANEDISETQNVLSD